MEEEEKQVSKHMQLFQFLSEVLGLPMEELTNERTKKHAASPTVEEWKHNLQEATASQGGFLSAKPRLCKNLFLKDTRKDSIWLVVAHIETEVKLSNLTKHLGFRTLRFAKEELLTQLLGVSQGSVTPLALFNDREKKVVNVIIDKVLLEAGLEADGGVTTLLVHPLSNEYTTELTVEEFKKFLAACGHPYQVLDFTTI